MRVRFALLSCLLLLAACSTEVQSNPTRTATEELLITGAADKAAEKIALAIPYGSKVFVDAGNLDGDDGKYAIATIKESLLRRNARLFEKREDADIVVAIRAGALSINRDETLVGTPSFSIPVPLTSGSLPIPELAIYKYATQKGVARFSAVAYEVKSGKFVAQAGPNFGFAHNDSHTVLFIISWTSNDVLPDEEDSDQVGSK